MLDPKKIDHPDNKYLTGHEYAILGVHTKYNNFGKRQDFVILKNPWREGDYLMEKINILDIESQLSDFPEIININKKHIETGVFFMPKEYFEKWFRTLLICKPNYKEYFPEVYHSLLLSKKVAEYYNYQLDQFIFEVTQGQNLIKIDVISKDEFESQKKIVEQKISKTNVSLIYDKNKLNTIWFDDKIIHQNDNIIFSRNKMNNKLEIKDIDEINEDYFNGHELFLPSKTYTQGDDDKCFRVFQMKQIKSKDELEILKNPNYNQDFSYISELKEDIDKTNELMYEIEEIIKNKNIFKGYKNIRVHIEGEGFEGWINIFDGINLVSDEYEDGHFHVHSYGIHEDSNLNLFDLIGQKFKCSCFYTSNGNRRYCDTYFTFNKKVSYSNCIYYIEGEKFVCPENQVAEYNLEKEKIIKRTEHTKRFFI